MFCFLLMHLSFYLFVFFFGWCFFLVLPLISKAYGDMS